MNKLILVSSLLLSSLFLFQFQLQAQDTLRNKEGGNYLFTVKKILKPMKFKTKTEQEHAGVLVR